MEIKEWAGDTVEKHSAYLEFRAPKFQFLGPQKNKSRKEQG